MQTVGDMGDFVTLMAVDVDPEKNRLEYVNARHCPAFLRDGQDLQEIKPTASLLGFHREKIPEPVSGMRPGLEVVHVHGWVLRVPGEW